MAEAKIEIYSTDFCPFCHRAMELLDRKGVTYDVIRIDLDDTLREAMLARTGGRKSVPQIFINDQHIGGCDELHALDRQGVLDEQLRNP